MGWGEGVVGGSRGTMTTKRWRRGNLCGDGIMLRLD